MKSVGHLLRIAAVLIGSAVAVVFGVSGASATALVDYGDFTLDTASTLDWLDLHFTAGHTYNQVLHNSGIGLIAHGWRFATATEIDGLFNAAGGSGLYPEQTNTATIGGNSTYAAALTLGKLLGDGVWSGDEHSLNLNGFLGNAYPGDPQFQQFAEIFAVTYRPVPGTDHALAALFDNYNLGDRNSKMSSFLVRAHSDAPIDASAVTPIPSALLMLVTALGCLGVTRWNQRRVA
jgi:hypothetical protein